MLEETFGEYSLFAPVCGNNFCSSNVELIRGGLAAGNGITTAKSPLHSSDPVPGEQTAQACVTA
jgi:hypothetical protein